MPSDPHAVHNLRSACGILATEHYDQKDAEEFFAIVLKQYIGEKYRNAMRKDIERIALAAKKIKSLNAVLVKTKKMLLAEKWEQILQLRKLRNIFENTYEERGGTAGHSKM